MVFEYDALNRVVKDLHKGVITNTYTYHAGGQLATEVTPQWTSSTLTLGYTSRLRTSLTQAQPTIGNWTHAYTWDNARRLDTLTGSSGSFDYDYIAAATSGDYASRLVKKLTVPTTSAGPNITNLWDTTGRLTETKLVNGGTTFNRHAYVLNAAHQSTLCAPGGSIVLPVATTPVFGGRCRHFLGIVHLPTKRAPRTTVDRGAVLECHRVKTVVASSGAAVLAVNPFPEVRPVPPPCSIPSGVTFGIAVAERAKVATDGEVLPPELSRRPPKWVVNVSQRLDHLIFGELFRCKRHRQPLLRALQSKLQTMTPMLRGDGEREGPCPS